jgi:hypothetical protein
VTPVLRGELGMPIRSGRPRVMPGQPTGGVDTSGRVYPNVKGTRCTVVCRRPWIDDLRATTATASLARCLVRFRVRVSKQIIDVRVVLDADHFAALPP